MDRLGVGSACSASIGSDRIENGLTVLVAVSSHVHLEEV